MFYSGVLVPHVPPVTASASDSANWQNVRDANFCIVLFLLYSWYKMFYRIIRAIFLYRNETAINNISKNTNILNILFEYRPVDAVSP